MIKKILTTVITEAIDKIDIDINIDKHINKAKDKYESIVNDINNMVNKSNVKTYITDETETSYRLKLPIPGVSKKDVSVKINCGHLNVVAKTKDVDYDLSIKINNDTVTASVLKHGILTVSLTKNIEENIEIK